MVDLLLHMRVIVLLDKLRIHDGTSFTTESFINDVLLVDGLLTTYRHYLGEAAFKRKMAIIIEDAICAKHLKKNGELLVATNNGRNIRGVLGFFEEVLKRRKRTLLVLGGGLLLALSPLIVSYLFGTCSASNV